MDLSFEVSYGSQGKGRIMRKVLIYLLKASKVLIVALAILAFCVAAAFLFLDRQDTKGVLLEAARDGHTESLGLAIRLGVEFSGRDIYKVAEELKENGQSAKDLQTAIRMFEAARTIYEKTGNKRGTELVTGSIGEVYQRLGENEKAIKNLEKAHIMSAEIGDERGTAVYLNNLGAVYFYEMQYDKAIDFYRKALQIWDKTLDRKGSAATHANLGNVYEALGQYDRALDHIQKALEENSVTRDIEGRGVMLQNIGHIYMKLGQYDAAIQALEKSLTICRKVGKLEPQGVILISIGSVYSQRGDSGKAIGNLKEGLSILENLGFHTDWAKAQLECMYLDIGELEKAESLIKSGNRWISLGLLNLYKKDYHKAKDYHERDLKVSEKNSDADLLFVDYCGLGAAYEGMSDYQKAAASYRKAIELTEEVRSRVPRDQREGFFDVKMYGFLRTAPYEGLARVLMKINQTVDAWRVSEYAKARVFAEGLSRRTDGQGFSLPENIVKYESELNDRIAGLKTRRQKALEKDNKETLTNLGPQINEWETKREAHIKMLREKYPLFAATKYPEPMDLSQTALRDNEWGLSYNVTDPGILIYLTRGKRLVKALFKPIPRKDVQELVRKFRASFDGVTEDNIQDKLRSFDFVCGMDHALSSANVTVEVETHATTVRLKS